MCVWWRANEQLAAGAALLLAAARLAGWLAGWRTEMINRRAMQSGWLLSKASEASLFERAARLAERA